MGYETKLMIGVSSNLGNPKELYFHPYAEINMCKMGKTSLDELPCVNGTPEKELWYWYDGEAKETTDKYGAYPKPLPIALVKAALQDDLAEHGYYRRLHWAIGLLEAMEDHNAEDIQVLVYGY